MRIKVNLNQLRHRCEQSIEDILRTEIADKGGHVAACPSYYGYLDRGSPILMVAHLDWVPVPWRFAVDSQRTRVYCPRLDDRLGVYTILDVLPSLGIECDVLLTTDEEIGQSTAQYFSLPRKYHWIVEFDRRGEDVVTYNLDSPDWLDSLRSHGFRIGQGSFSDICYLDADCCCANIGIGYHHEHSSQCYVELSEYRRQLARFVRFYSANRTTPYDQEPMTVVEEPSKSYWSNWNREGMRYTSERCRVCDDWLLVSEQDVCWSCLSTSKESS